MIEIKIASTLGWRHNLNAMAYRGLGVRVVGSVWSFVDLLPLSLVANERCVSTT